MAFRLEFMAVELETPPKVRVLLRDPDLRVIFDSGEVPFPCVDPGPERNILQNTGRLDGINIGPLASTRWNS